jgi:vacuolar-type H+-ATPase subunit I/STV1
MADVTVEVLKEIRAELGALRTEMRSESGQLRTEMRSEIGRLRTELRSEIGQLRSELGEFRTDVNDRFEVMERRQTAAEIRLATEVVAVVGAVRDLRDVLLEDRELRAQVRDHEDRLGRLERQR